MSMLLLKTICINPRRKEEEEGEGVHFWNDWNIAAAAATGAKGGAGDTRRILLKDISGTFVSFQETGIPLRDSA